MNDFYLNEFSRKDGFFLLSRNELHKYCPDHLVCMQERWWLRDRDDSFEVNGTVYFMAKNVNKYGSMDMPNYQWTEKEGENRYLHYVQNGLTEDNIYGIRPAIQLSPETLAFFPQRNVWWSEDKGCYQHIVEIDGKDFWLINEEKGLLLSRDFITHSEFGKTYDYATSKVREILVAEYEKFLNPEPYNLIGYYIEHFGKLTKRRLSQEEVDRIREICIANDKWTFQDVKDFLEINEEKIFGSVREIEIIH